MLKTKSVLIIVLVVFSLNTLGPLPKAEAQEFRLPAAGVMVHLSSPFNPPILKGIKVHADNPFRFDFILDQGDSSVIARSVAQRQSYKEQLKTESTKLIKYFLASLTIPEKDLWVNLSPYEKDRIIPQSFGLTEMGRDLLAQDYMLKQITASLIYPEGETGQRFWKRIYEEAVQKYGTTNVAVNTFNKVWIVPEKAVVYENAKAGTAYVVDAKLKVMLEQDYLSLSRHSERSEESKSTLRSSVDAQSERLRGLGSQILREIVIPELTKEVNKNKNFVKLRQVYNSLILATWYKKKIKDSILTQVYEDKNKVSGVNIADPKEIEKIYHRYLQAFKKGVYNYIKEEKNLITQEIIPRKYFSGGVPLFEIDRIMITGHDQAMIDNIDFKRNMVEDVVINQAMVSIAVKDVDNITALVGHKYIFEGRWKEQKVIIKATDPKEGPFKASLLVREKDVLMNIHDNYPSIARHVPQVFGYGTFDEKDLKKFPPNIAKPELGSFYLIEEKVEGETLGEHIKKDSRETEVFNALIMVAKTLQQMNALGIYHRNFSLSETFLNNGGVKLIDFEVAETPSLLITDELRDYQKRYMRAIFDSTWSRSGFLRDMSHFISMVLMSLLQNQGSVKINNAIKFFRHFIKKQDYWTQEGASTLSWEYIITNLEKMRDGGFEFEGQLAIDILKDQIFDISWKHFSRLQEGAEVGYINQGRPIIILRPDEIRYMQIEGVKSLSDGRLIFLPLGEQKGVLGNLPEQDSIAGLRAIKEALDKLDMAMVAKPATAQVRLDSPVTDPNEIFSLLNSAISLFNPNELLRLEKEGGPKHSINKRALAIIKRFGMFYVHGNLIYDRKIKRSILITGRASLGKSTITSLLIVNSRFTFLADDSVIAYFDSHGILQAGRSSFLAPKFPGRRRTREGKIEKYAIGQGQYGFFPVGTVIHLSRDPRVQRFSLTAGKVDDRFNDDPLVPIEAEKAKRIKNSGVLGINVLVSPQPRRDYEQLTTAIIKAYDKQGGATTEDIGPPIKPKIPRSRAKLSSERSRIVDTINFAIRKGRISGVSDRAALASEVSSQVRLAMDKAMRPKPFSRPKGLAASTAQIRAARKHRLMGYIVYGPTSLSAQLDHPIKDKEIIKIFRTMTDFMKVLEDSKNATDDQLIDEIDGIVVQHYYEGQQKMIGRFKNPTTDEQVKIRQLIINHFNKALGDYSPFKDRAMAAPENTGGIDLTPANMNLQTNVDGNGMSANDKGGIKFNFDLAQLTQLRNAPGFVPVIVNIQPMTDLKKFLDELPA